MVNFQLPEWVATQFYTLEDNSAIAYIFNHKSNEFLLLDNYAAKIWNLIVKKTSDKEIIEFVKKNNIEDELDSFINSLTSLELIKSNKKTNQKNNNADSNVKFEQSTDFQNETTEFLGNHGFLPRLFLELTYNCNLNCIHCFNNKSCKKEIKFNDIKSAIDEAVELGAFYITLSGGECTLNKDFIKIIEYIRKKRVTFSVFTNGQTLYDDKELFEKILSYYPLQIALSVYSMNSEIHDMITGVKGSLNKTLSVIKSLKKRNINIEIKSFLTKYNAYEYSEIQKFAKENNISFSLDYSLLSNPSKSNTNVRITRKQLLDLYLDDESMYSIKSMKPHRIDDNFNKHRICNGGHNGLLIDPNLDVYVCTTLRIPLGNYKKTSLKSIWKNKSCSSNINKIRNLKHLDLQNCYKHDYCKYCIYCPGIVYTANQYKLPYQVFCDEAKTKMEAANIVLNSKI